MTRFQCHIKYGGLTGLGGGVTLRFAVESERVDALTAAVNDAAAGQVRLVTGEEAYRPVAKK